MKKLLLVPFLIITLSSYAQWFVETDIGYACSLNKESDWYSNMSVVRDQNGNSEYNNIETEFTIAQSPFIMLRSGYEFNRLEFSLGFIYYDQKSMGSLNKLNSYYINTKQWISVSDDQYVDRNESHTFYMRRYVLSPEIGYVIPFKSLTIQPYIGGVLQLIDMWEVQKEESKYYFEDIPPEQQPKDLSQVWEFKYSPNTKVSNLFGIRTGIKFSYYLNNIVSISLNCTYSLSNNYFPEAKYRTKYIREQNDEVNISGVDERLISSIYDYNMNTLELSIGIRYYFN